MAFTDTLGRFADGRVHYWPQDECGLMPIADIIEGAAPEAHIYACGPEPMLASIARYCADSQTPRTLRFERFGAAVPTTSETTSSPPGDGQEAAGSFEVELQNSGVRLTVPPDRSVLDVVREAVPEVESSCEEGYCGTCETRVLEGRPDHRDTYLTEEERASNEVMMICVSRSRGSLLRLLL